LRWVSSHRVNSAVYGIDVTRDHQTCEERTSWWAISSISIVASPSAGPGSTGEPSWKGTARAFVRTYNFLAQILPWGNAGWERLSIFLSFLTPRLPAPKDDEGSISEEILRAIDLDSYRAEQKKAIDLALEDDEAVLENPDPRAGGLPPEAEKDLLSHILQTFNEIFADADFTDADRVAKHMSGPVMDALVGDEGLRQIAASTDEQNQRIAFSDALDKIVNANWQDNYEVLQRLGDDPQFRDAFGSWMLRLWQTRVNDAAWRQKAVLSVRLCLGAGGSDHPARRWRYRLLSTCTDTLWIAYASPFTVDMSAPFDVCSQLGEHWTLFVDQCLDVTGLYVIFAYQVTDGALEGSPVRPARFRGHIEEPAFRPSQALYQLFGPAYRAAVGILSCRCVGQIVAEPAAEAALDAVEYPPAALTPRTRQPEALTTVMTRCGLESDFLPDRLPCLPMPADAVQER
jgi:hypothetical protein